MAKSNLPIKTVRRKPFISFAIAFKGIGVFLPIIAAAMTLLFNFFYPTTWPQENGDVLILLAGFISSLLIALVYALCSMPFVGLTNKGLQDYASLKIIEEKLRSRLGNPVFESGNTAIPEKERTEYIDFLSLKQDSQKLAVYTEACRTYYELKNILYSPNAAQMFSNQGDVYAWTMANQTQEALIKIEAIAGIIDEAKQVYTAIQASSINNRDGLLKGLARSISVFDPQLAESLYGEGSDKQIESLRKEIRELHNTLEVKADTHNSALSPAGEVQTHDRQNTENSQSAIEAEARMRSTIHFISSSLHRFQENYLAGILQARNNLVLATLASGIITYVLICVSIIAIAQNFLDPKSLDFMRATTALASAVVIYTTGVATGLFGRLYVEANKESAVKDYGLSRTRLQAIPLASGLAAIGGVFITTTTFGSTNESAVLMSVFTPTVRTILIAMIFGFAPNLLIKGFERHSDQYVPNAASAKEK